MAKELFTISSVLSGGVGHGARADIAAGAGPVFHDHGLAQLLCRLAPIRRASRSVPPPGGNVTTMVMGCVG